MAMTKKGSRSIVVDGQKFRWKIRRQPTYCQGNEWSGLTVSVEQFINPGAILLIDTGRLRLDSWINPPSENGVTPSEVAESIRKAIDGGWRPAVPGSAFQLQAS